MGRPSPHLLLPFRSWFSYEGPYHLRVGRDHVKLLIKRSTRCRLSPWRPLGPGRQGLKTENSFLPDDEGRFDRDIEGHVVALAVNDLDQGAAHAPDGVRVRKHL